MILHSDASQDVTLVQNRFIDEYMALANGEFVKVYLYLLRCFAGRKEFTLSTAADALNHTESDVRRALTYWQKQQLLRLTVAKDGTLTELTLLQPPCAEPSKMQSADVPEQDSGRMGQYASGVQEIQTAPAKLTVSPDRQRELAGQEEVKQLLFNAEQYLSKQLSRTEVNHLLYFYDELHFSFDLIEYLLEYCVSKGKRSISYIRKVALEWAAQGISTVAEAKKDTNLYHKDYYTVLNAFGIKGRGPAQAEIDFMNLWFHDYGFTTDIVLEAANRTITRIHTPSFEYTDRILKTWKEAGVHHIGDIAALDKPAPQSTSRTSQKKAAGQVRLPQRAYDFDQLEKQLLDC